MARPRFFKAKPELQATILAAAVQEFAKNGGAAVWDFHVSDRVLSPTMRRAHPPGKHKAA